MTQSSEAAHDDSPAIGINEFVFIDGEFSGDPALGAWIARIDCAFGEWHISESVVSTSPRALLKVAYVIYGWKAAPGDLTAAAGLS